MSGIFYLRDRSPCRPKTRPSSNAVTVNHRGTEAQRHRGTEAQRHRGTEAQRHRGTEAQRHRGTEAQRHRGTEAQRHRGTEGTEIRELCALGASVVGIPFPGARGAERPRFNLLHGVVFQKPDFGPSTAFISRQFGEPRLPVVSLAVLRKTATSSTCGENRNWSTGVTDCSA